jgi:hypothetical protein
VCHTSRQLADGVQTLGVPQLLLGGPMTIVALTLIRDVARDTHRAHDLPVSVTEW